MDMGGVMGVMGWIWGIWGGYGVDMGSYGGYGVDMGWLWGDMGWSTSPPTSIHTGVSVGLRTGMGPSVGSVGSVGSVEFRL